MVKQHRNNLFNDCDLSVILENIFNSIEPQVEAIPEEEFIASSEDILTEKIVAENSIQPIILHEEKIRMSKPALCRLTPAGRIYRSENGPDLTNLKDGMITQVEIPYSGDKRLLVSRPSMHYTHGGPSFTIKDDRIVKYYVRPLYSDPKLFKEHFLRNYEKISKYLEWQANDLALFKKKLCKLVAVLVAKRRNRSKRVEVHLNPKPGTPKFTPIHIRNNLTHHAHRIKGKDTPIISDNDFIKTLRVLRHTGSSFERTPAIYSVHNDQDLRNILVSNLNTHFTSANKEDIFKRIGENGYTVSVSAHTALLGKCSTWHCEEGLIYTLNSLFYEELCNSCKIVLILFNRTEKNFPVLLKCIKKTLLKHPCMVKLKKEFAENEWHTIMNKYKNIPHQHWVHLMIFNLFFDKLEHTHQLTKEEREFFANL